MKLFIGILIVLTIYMNYEYILTYYANWFYITDISKNSNAIIILGGNVYSRPEAAIRLYKEGYGSNIFITNVGKPESKYPSIIKSDTELTKEIFNLENIPLTVITNINHKYVTSTFDEAYDICKYFKKKNKLHIILITDDYSSRRTLYAFHKICNKMKKKWRIEIFAVKSQIYNASNWWRTEKGLKNYLTEPMKFLFYIFADKTSSLINSRN